MGALQQGADDRERTECQLHRVDLVMSCIECSCCCAVGRDRWVQDRRFGRVCDSRKSCREREECGKLRMRVELRECARTPRASYTFTLALCFVYHFLFTSQMSSCVSYCFICSNVVRPLFVKSANSPFCRPSPRVSLDDTPSLPAPIRLGLAGIV